MHSIRADDTGMRKAHQGVVCCDQPTEDEHAV